jgi:flagellar motor switch protein FliM
LAEVSQFKIGQVISLPFSPASLIPLECVGKRLFNCALGQKDGFYTIRIEDVVDDQMEFLHSILSK